MTSRHTLFIAAAIILCLTPPTLAATGGAKNNWCGTGDARKQEVLATHLLNKSRLAKQGRKTGTARAIDIDNIAVIEDDGTVIVPVNPFDIDKGTKVTFTPNGSTGFTVSSGAPAFVKGGKKLTAFVGGGPGTPTDDGYQEVPFKGSFSFQFYGQTYDRVFVGTNGFVTFGEGDVDSPVFVAASKLASKQARIAAFWTDLDTTNAAVTVSQTSSVVAITWKKVQIFGENGGSIGSNTFQLQLHRDGKVAIIYKLLTNEAELIGLSPGHNLGPLARVDVTNPTSGAVTGSLFENFAYAEEIDVPALVQAFYRTHADNYDFVYLWTDFPTSLGNAFAYYLHVTNDIEGIGQPITNESGTFGSAGKLRGVINVNRPDLYPEDPSDMVPGLGLNSSLSILAHEQGHRWGAFVRFMRNGTPTNDLLGRDNDHWSFYFNTETTLSTPGERHSSALEGNVIRDNGDGSFTTVTNSVNYYSELDQYLMGVRPSSEVGPMFVVPDGGPRRADGAVNGAPFSGTRTPVTIEDIIAAEGPRAPAYPAAQKSWRGAWILLVRPGTSPEQATLAKLNLFRTSFETYFNHALQGRGSLSLTLQ